MRSSNHAWTRGKARSPSLVPTYVALAGCIGAACSNDPSSSGEAWIHVQLQMEGGFAPRAFQATLAGETGRVQTLVCPPQAFAPTEAATCTDDGFAVLAAPGALDVTVRSSGNAFVSTTVPAGTATVALVLQPLPPAEVTADYATRLDGETCLAVAQALAVAYPTDVGDSYSVKFYVGDVQGEPKVYFQNTKKNPLHFDFAQSVLGVPGTPEEFAAQTYSGQDRRALAGTLVYYPAVKGSGQGATPSLDAPWTLNFFPSDDLTPEQVRLAHRLLEERLTCLSWAGPEERLVYLPATALHEEQAAADADTFERRGIGWMTHADLFGGISVQALNPGTAFGTLRRMTPEDLATTVVSFRDVLLLTRLPNELPVVGGTITEELQTPLAHVNVAARTRGTPNLAYPNAFADAGISSLIGKLVRFEVTDSSFTLREATLDEAEAFWNGRAPERYVPAFDSSMTDIPSFDQVGFADSVRIGVKAANLAEMTHFLGEHAPSRGLAIPFHYYDAYMSSSRTSAGLCDAAASDCLASGRDPLACQAARALCLPAGGAGETFMVFAARVIEDPTFKQDTAVRDGVLANLRYFIEQTAVDVDFAALLDNRVAEVFGTSKVKIRSSTNAEDLPSFSGAGLYDSCPAYASGARAASVVVREVFASVWSFRGFEERSFWNIDHLAVRMGCAINEAFSKELANGVLITANIADPTVYGMYVNVQKGEASVTNPSDGALPEIFSILAGPQGVEVARQRFSSLSPSLPLLSAAEIATLYQAASQVQAHFAPLYRASIAPLVLDLEFKLTAERTIVIKQARPYTPSPR